MNLVPGLKKPLPLKKIGVNELSVLRRSCVQMQQDYPKVNKEQKILDLTGRIYDFRLQLPPGLQVLDLSDNLGLDPTFIFEYDIPTLQTLRLNHCDLTDLPSEAPRFASTLRTFSLDGNLLKELPRWLFEMPELNELSLYGNEIESVEFPQNSHLIKVINFSYNPITRVTTEENFNVQLLNFTQTKLSSIPDLFLPQLKTLCLSKCCIEGHLDYSICPNLLSLDLSFNKIESLSDNFVNSCKCLTNLNLSNNLLECLPECFSSSPNLTKISLSNNRLTSLPTSFMNSLTLENLNISYNKIEKLQPFRFNNLRYLNISNNQIAELPDCFDTSIFFTSLNASFNKLTDLPPSMKSCHKIMELNCTHNLFNHIPSAVFSFSNLKTLIFSGNTLTTVPESLSALYYLTNFDLSNNNITTFPTFIQNMHDLRTISFSHNRISSVTNVTFPSKVQSIDLSFNIIENLSINPLTSLANLAIQYNRLKKVPNLSDFPNLQFFSIAYNEIEENSSIELFDTCSAEIEVFGNDDHISIQNCGKAHLASICPSNHFGIGIASSLGTRQTMEDAFTITSSGKSDFLAIFDGHAGHNASRHLSDFIGDHIFQNMDAENSKSAERIPSSLVSTLVESNKYIKSLNIIDGSTAAGIFVTMLPSSALAKEAQQAETDENNKSNQTENTNTNENIESTENTNSNETQNKNNNSSEIQNANDNSNETEAMTKGENANSTETENHSKTDNCNYSESGDASECSYSGEFDTEPANNLVNMMYVFGIGDSRVLHVSKKIEDDAQLTEDQKPTNIDEYKRLKRAGFFISPEGRINRKLAVSRTMGDFWCHEEGLFVEPEICQIAINREKDVGVVIACDGLWDVVTNETAADVLRMSETASDAAIALKNLAIASGSQDNVSVIAILWNPKEGDEGIAPRNTVAELPPYVDEQDVNETPTVMTGLPPKKKRRRV